jgi:elongator complex protein 3
MSMEKEIIDKIRSGKIRSQRQLDLEKTRLAKKYYTNRIIKNAEIAEFLDKKDRDYSRIQKFLKIKPVRTISGVANIAVMWISSDTCPGKCIYCPKGKNTPQSYTGTEPATLRAIRMNYDPYRQVENRLRQLRIIGHPTDKCELIIMGGTFMMMPHDFRKLFIKGCLEAMNGKESDSLEEAIKRNEKAKTRCIGLTIETRSDYCDPEEILELGATRVEIGLQSTDDAILNKINRGHGTAENIAAIKRCRQAGLKICLHWMPGLTGLEKLNMKKELAMFREIFNNPGYRPDELKIYPVLVIKGTKLYAMWKKGKYKEMSLEQTAGLLKEMKKIIPEYVRVKRVMRDISQKEVAAGPGVTNLRQLIEKGHDCRCIRCREVKDKMPKNLKLKKIEYEAAGGKEIFLSFESRSNIAAFLRLRIDGDACAKVRELHVYGPMAELGKKRGMQHSGLGKKLLKEAEKVARKSGKKYMQITSGIGAREYYRKLGYRLDGFYMRKAF